MDIGNEILHMLEQAKRSPAKAEMRSNLFTELAIDSLSFVALLLEIENIYSITFGLEEMGQCVEASRLVELVNKKLEGKRDNA